MKFVVSSVENDIMDACLQLKIKDTIHIFRLLKFYTRLNTFMIK